MLITLTWKTANGDRKLAIAAKSIKSILRRESTCRVICKDGGEFEVTDSFDAIVGRVNAAMMPFPQVGECPAYLLGPQNTRIPFGG